MCAGLGYQVYQYDQYRDAFKLDPTKGHHFQLNTEAWPDMIVHRGRVDDFSVRTGKRRRLLRLLLPLARKHFDDTFSAYDYSAWFLDCLGSVGFNAEAECYESRHACDRYDTRRERIELLAEVDRRRQTRSTECGIDYLLPHLHWVEEGTTLVRWVGALERRQSPENDSINAAGGMKAIGCPRGDREARAAATPPRSRRHQHPLSNSLLFALPPRRSDPVLAVGRWNGTAARVLAVEEPLDSALRCGARCIRVLRRTEKWQKEIGLTDRYVGSFVRDVAFEVMTSHRFVTPDRLLQETEFSSGRGVVVNFGDTDQTLLDGQLVPRRNYVRFVRRLPAGPTRCRRAPTYLPIQLPQRRGANRLRAQTMMRRVQSRTLRRIRCVGAIVLRNRPVDRARTSGGDWNQL